MSRRILLDRLAGDPGAVLIDGDRIVGLGPEAAGVGDVQRVACDGLRAVPGFLDLQVNGVEHHDFTSAPASMWEAGTALARHGVTAFLPTIVSSGRGTVEAALAALASGPVEARGAVPLGLHIEGPFISPRRRGAHAERHLRAPDLDELPAWVAGGARIVTLAPELPGGLAAVREVASAGAIASVGHTDADADLTRQAIDAGARMATHLFNAMPPFHHRAPGAAGALLDDERVTVGLIGDGVHVDPLLLRLVARSASGRTMLVSDAVATRLGDVELIADGGSARLSDGTLAGSPHAIDHGVRTFAGAVGSADAAIDAVTSVPARLLGLADGRGMLHVGGRADVVLLDEDLGVAATLVGGRPAYLGDQVAWP